MSAFAFKFISNACGIFTGSQGTRLLCDPWIEDGVYEGSWCHFPPLTTRPEDLLDVDAVYVSHLHPDHFDERTFDFPRDTPLIILDHGPTFLMKILKGKGYTNLILIKDGETVAFREFRLSLFAPFASHIFHPAGVGNLIDSALMIEDGELRVLNANDNVLTLEAAHSLRQSFGRLDLAMLNYNAAGPYPSCFDNYSHEEKMAQRLRILERNFMHLQALVDILEPRFILPFAGAYVLGGAQWRKNDYLATTTWDECGEWLKAHIVADTQVLLMREHDEFDIAKGFSNRPYIPIDAEAAPSYISDILSKRPYPHEADPQPDPAQMDLRIETAAHAMQRRMKNFGMQSSFDVIIHAFDRAYRIYPTFSRDPEHDAGPRRLDCRMDVRLLNRIVEGRVHWNNAEGGAHIDFVRVPDMYEYDIHTALEFFHN